MFKALDKIVDKILPLEIDDEDQPEEEEEHEDTSEIREMLKEEDTIEIKKMLQDKDPEYNEMSSDDGKIIRVNRSREFRKNQRVSADQLKPINKSQNKGKNKTKNKTKNKHHGEQGDGDPRS